MAWSSFDSRGNTQTQTNDSKRILVIVGNSELQEDQDQN